MLRTERTNLLPLILLFSLPFHKCIAQEEVELSIFRAALAMQSGEQAVTQVSISTFHCHCLCQCLCQCVDFLLFLYRSLYICTNHTSSSFFPLPFLLHTLRVLPHSLPWTVQAWNEAQMTVTQKYGSYVNLRGDGDVDGSDAGDVEW